MNRVNTVKRLYREHYRDPLAVLYREVPLLQR